MKLLVLVILVGFSNLAFGFTSNRKAPDGPGIQGTWSRPDKSGFLASRSQKLWATIANGILTETYFPLLDRAQSRDTQFAFVLGNKVLLESQDFKHKTQRHPKSLAYHVDSMNETYGIRIAKDFVLNESSPAIVVSYDIFFDNVLPNEVVLMHNPATENSLGGDGIQVTASNNGKGEMLSFQSDRRGDEPAIFAKRSFQFLTLDQPAEVASAGFEGVNSPWEQLLKFKKLKPEYDSAFYGNVSGGLGIKPVSAHLRLRLALAFTLENELSTDDFRIKTLETLKNTTAHLISNQQDSWLKYLNKLNPLGQQFEAHAIMLKGLEDKTFQGAIIAAPSLPWLPTSIEAPETNYEKARLRKEDVNGGYHRVWPRDLVQMALGLMAVGDFETAEAVAKNLKRIQRPDGVFPQNVWIDGTESWQGFQIDQTGFPISLIARLVENGSEYGPYRSMVQKAAEAIAKKGPFTDMERWEESSGLSPNSIAVACQGLLDASWLEKDLDASRSDKYKTTCELWSSKLKEWTFVENGPLGTGYFERLEQGGQYPVDPNLGSPFFLHNEPVSGNNFRETDIIDGGFLQWIIAGLIPPNDPDFSSTLNIYDKYARAQTPAGLGYLRYNNDGYGWNHLGRAWPLLSGERAIAALLRNEDANEHMQVLLGSVSSSDTICEQTEVSACPLGWAHAALLITAKSIADGKSFYVPRRIDNYYSP